MENIKLKAIKLNLNKEIVPLASNISLFSKMNLKVTKRKSSVVGRVNTDKAISDRNHTDGKVTPITDENKAITKRTARVHSTSFSKVKNVQKTAPKSNILRNLSHKKNGERKAVINTALLARSPSMTKRIYNLEISNKTTRATNLLDTEATSTLTKNDVEQLFSLTNIEGPEDLHFFNVRLTKSNRELSMKFDSVN